MTEPSKPSEADTRLQQILDDVAAGRLSPEEANALLAGTDVAVRAAGRQALTGPAG